MAIASPSQLKPRLHLLLILPAVLVVMAALAATSPAKALACDTPKAIKPGDPSFACLHYSGGKQYLDVCDHDADNHYVYARFVDSSTYPRYTTTPIALGVFGYDLNGSASGCGNFVDSRTIYAYAVCIQTEGCSNFVRLRQLPVVIAGVPGAGGAAS
jgi:hypothetical protein